MNDQSVNARAARSRVAREYSLALVERRAYREGFGDGWLAADASIGPVAWEAGFDSGRSDCAEGAWDAGMMAGAGAATELAKRQLNDDVYREGYRDALADHGDVVEALKHRIRELEARG